MPTIIDSLIVQLGLDVKDVDGKAPGVHRKLSDLEKSASKTETGVKGIGKASKDTAGELTVLSSKLASFLAVIGGTVAVRAFVKDTIETNTQLYFLSRNLEMSTQKLFAWGAAAQEIGGNKGAIQNFMRTIAGMPGELLTGKMPQLLPLFARLGISFREPFDKIMVDLSKRFAGMDRKMAFSFGMASGIPEDVMNLLLQGPGAVQAAMVRTKGFGPTEKEAASAAELKRRFTDLELQLVKIGYDLLYKITPYLEKFLDLLQKIGAWAQRHEKIVAIIAGVAAALAAVAALASALGAVSFAWTALAGAVEAAGPFLAVLGIVAALGAAVLLLWNDYRKWAEGGNSWFDWGEFERNVRKAGEAFKWLGGQIEEATNRFENWLRAHGIKVPENAVKKALIWGWNNTTLPGLLGIKIKPSKPESEDDLLERIFTREGFYDTSSSGKQNIPQKAHNPGDILYGDFAVAHGATGYILAQGGKKVATFPDDETGKAAARALLGTKEYANLSPAEAISRWQTGSATALMNGVANASRIPASVSSSSSMSTASTDNSWVTNIGTINLHSPVGGSAMTPSMARGMDWTTLLTQQNAGLI
jgi:hypothetical protein